MGEKPTNLPSDCWQKILEIWVHLSTAHKIALCKHHKGYDSPLTKTIQSLKRLAMVYRRDYVINNRKWSLSMYEATILAAKHLTELKGKRYAKAIKSISIRPGTGKSIQFHSVASKQGSIAPTDTQLS